MPAAPATHRAAIALGSSLDSALGTREGHLAAAFDALDATPTIRVIARSEVIQTAPVGPTGALAADIAAQPDYLNAAAILRTTLGPRALLDRLLEIELARGRDRAREGRWGPRTLDLDLLLYDDVTLDEPGLTIPHPRLTERAFVLVPLAQIAADWAIPGPGSRPTTVAQALSRLAPESLAGIRPTAPSPHRPAAR